MGLDCEIVVARELPWDDEALTRLTYELTEFCKTFGLPSDSMSVSPKLGQHYNRPPLDVLKPEQKCAVITSFRFYGDTYRRGPASLILALLMHLSANEFWLVMYGGDPANFVQPITKQVIYELALGAAKEYADGRKTKNSLVEN